MLRRLVGAAAGSVAVLLATSVSAAPYTSGSFGFTSAVTPPSDVVTSPTFTLVPPQIMVTSVVGDFVGVLAPLVTLLGMPPGAVNFGAVGCCNWSGPGGSFTGTVAPVQTQTTPHPNASSTWDVVGTFTVGAPFDNVGEVLTANMTWSLTQTGSSTSAVSISGTFNAPRVTVPEPTTLFLLGIGLTGVALSRRRKA